MELPDLSTIIEDVLASNDGTAGTSIYILSPLAMHSDVQNQILGERQGLFSIFIFTVPEFSRPEMIINETGVPKI
ncbi:unnamed protein product [Adineta ricciae]|uniref:Uncharacterized protein n=1 Tax=Adineta ricciae TaxID=249248 RepID=A0A814MUM6_ADIRI|nr:unnamed protein product [Adineta ricciae]CAF1083009.1 unnamed protein product [Adineta ricciae]